MNSTMIAKNQKLVVDANQFKKIERSVIDINDLFIATEAELIIFEILLDKMSEENLFDNPAMQVALQDTAYRLKSNVHSVQFKMQETDNLISSCDVGKSL